MLTPAVTVLLNSNLPLSFLKSPEHKIEGVKLNLFLSCPLLFSLFLLSPSLPDTTAQTFSLVRDAGLTFLTSSALLIKSGESNLLNLFRISLWVVIWDLSCFLPRPLVDPFN